MKLGDILARKVNDANRIVRRIFPEKITLMPKLEAGKRFYEAMGTMNLYGFVGFTAVANGVPWSNAL